MATRGGKRSFNRGFSLTQLTTIMALSLIGSFTLLQVYKTTISSAMKTSRADALHSARERVFKNISCGATLATGNLPTISDPGILGVCISSVGEVQKEPFLRMTDKKGRPLFVNESGLEGIEGDWRFRASCYLDNSRTCVMVHKAAITEGTTLSPDGWSPLFDFPLCCDSRAPQQSNPEDPCDSDPPVTASEPCGNNSGAGTPSALVSTEAQLRKVLKTRCARKIILENDIALTTDWDAANPMLIALDGAGFSITGLKTSAVQTGASLLGRFTSQNHPTRMLHVCNLKLPDVQLMADRSTGAVFSEIKGNSDLPFTLVMKDVEVGGQISGVLSDAGGIGGRMEDVRAIVSDLKTSVNLQSPRDLNSVQRIGGAFGEVLNVDGGDPLKAAFENILASGAIQIQDIGSVTPSTAVGGVFGAIGATPGCGVRRIPSIRNITHNGTIQIDGRANNVGGIFGFAFMASIQFVTSLGQLDVLNTSENVGGIAGCWLGQLNTANAASVSNQKNVKASLGKNVGAMFGTVMGSIHAKAPSGNSINSTVQGNSCVGKVAGTLYTNVALTDITSTSTATGNDHVNITAPGIGCANSFAIPSQMTTYNLCEITASTCGL